MSTLGGPVRLGCCTTGCKAVLSPMDDCYARHVSAPGFGDSIRDRPGGMNRPGWGSLRPPSAKDLKGRGGAKGFSAPLPPLTHLCVLDFEWTCSDRKKMEPCAEITQFPTVLVRLDGRNTCVLDEFDTFVRPQFNPILSTFATQLTGITQSDVDAAPPLHGALIEYLQWLQSHGLVDGDGNRTGSWCFCTWSDADIGSTFTTECRHKGEPVPGCVCRSQSTDLWVMPASPRSLCWPDAAGSRLAFAAAFRRGST